MRRCRRIDIPSAGSKVQKKKEKKMRVTVRSLRSLAKTVSAITERDIEVVSFVGSGRRLYAVEASSHVNKGMSKGVSKYTETLRYGLLAGECEAFLSGMIA